ncbi:MAG: threonylcarbamoyl-AMP synthase [Blautia sp.]|nr:threonylcarbamoyl-AMP synthase [Blautia sp.]
MKLSSDGPDQAMLERAGRVLKEGGLVAFPTETVYGLGGNALDPGASEKIYKAKGRPSDNPLIVHIARLSDLYTVAAEVPEKALKMADKFWPGPLTMIFRKTDAVPDKTTGGLDSVAVRFPSDPIAQGLILAAGGFVAAPSANTSGRPSPVSASHVIEDLGDKVDIIIDGGEAVIGLESTIVDFTEEPPVILRPGYITREKISTVIPDIRTDPGIIAENSDIRPKAPGMKYRHYAPKASLSIVEGPEEEVVGLIRELTHDSITKGKKAGIIATDETCAKYTEGNVKCIGSRGDEEEIAHNLYTVLRAFDDEEVDVILSESFDSPGMGQAIMNRLLKAAGHSILYTGGKT